MRIDADTKWIFVSAFASSLLLMASGLFLGTIGIDDELHITAERVSGIGRGLWGWELVCLLLPGQMGISFAPAFLGCALYAISVTILIHLWSLKSRHVARASAAIMGCFPYFASMMTFDVVQVAYPLAFVAITASAVPIYSKTSVRALFGGAALFAAAFSLYQGVATTFATVVVSIAMARIGAGDEPMQFIRMLGRRYLPRALAVAAIGGLAYLASDRIARQMIPHEEWAAGYRVTLDLAFGSPERLQACLANITSLIMGETGDLPKLSAILFLALLLGVALGLLAVRSWPLWQRLALLIALALSIFVLPFWINFIQQSLLTPRSTVGLGALYAVVFAVLASRQLWALRAMAKAVGAIWCLQFVFVGNEMYYCQHLASLADHSTAVRLAARIDGVAVEHNLTGPIPVVLIGTYSPVGGAHARFSTLGASTFSWRDGSMYRQAQLLRLLGIDGYRLETDPQLISAARRHIEENSVQRWPDPRSVFAFEGVVAVNFGPDP